MRTALLDSGQFGHQRIQRVLHDKNDASPSRGHQRHISRELNRVSQPFVSVNQKGLAGDLFVSVPKWLAEIRLNDRKGNLPARFTSRPARVELLGQQLEMRAMKFASGIVRVERLKVVVDL
jgi:hypothetical protein